MLPPSPPSPPAPDARRWWVLATVMIGTMASVMSSTIVNVAVPDMSRVFTLGQERAQWMSGGFMAAMTVSMLLTPWLLARFGYRRAYAGVTLLLMGGGIGGGLAGSYEFVLAMRVVEGLAAGVMQPIPGIIILRAFQPHEQGRAMGIFGMGVVLAPAIGPSVGGLLVELYGWRSIFFVVVPLCLAALVMTRRFLPHVAPGGAAPGRGRVRLDLPALALMTATILALLNGMVTLQAAQHGGPAWVPALLLGGAALGLVAFLRHQHRADHPLLDPELFTHRPFAMGGIVAFIYGAALFGSTYLVPVFMQVALGLPPSRAGAVLFPAGISLALTIPAVGRLADRAPIHVLVSLGIALLAVSFALMVAVGPETALMLIAAWAVVGRIGLGFVLPSLNLGAMRGLPSTLIPAGSSSINFLRQLGGAVGVSFVGILLESRLRFHEADALAGRLQAFHETFAALALITVLALAAAWRMRRPPSAS